MALAQGYIMKAFSKRARNAGEFVVIEIRVCWDLLLIDAGRLLERLLCKRGGDNPSYSHLIGQAPPKNHNYCLQKNP